MTISRRVFLATGAVFPFARQVNSAAAENRSSLKIQLLLTSPVTDVAAAPHSSLPRILGYWPNAGLDIDVRPFSGSSAATQVLLSGRADFTMASPEPLLAARQEGGKLLAVYNHTREPIYTIAVENSSPIRDLRDLKGKTIGLVNLAGGAFQFSKAMLTTVGMDPEKDVTWLPVGLGPQTAHALKAKQIDALALWDHAYAGLENIGFKFRHFTTPETSALLGFMLIGNENFVIRNPEATAKMVQGIAKSVVFARTNPTAAVRLHWELFPSSKPNNVSEDEAIRQSVHLLNSRLDKYRIKGRKTERWGYFEKDDWEQTQNFFYTTGLLKKKIDVQDYFTNRFSDLANDFDENEVISSARKFDSSRTLQDK